MRQMSKPEDEVDSQEGRAEPLEREVAELKKKNDELLTRLKYAQADLENYRKRTDKELKEAGESLTRSLLGKLIVVQDQLDLAVEHAAKGKANGELREGIAMVQRNLRSAMESVGLERIDCVGKPFDPSVHEAVEKVQGKTPGVDVVLEELRPGFVFRGQLLRPSMVKVEVAKQAEEEAKASE
jgi:molecular chaperone GrpE